MKPNLSVICAALFACAATSAYAASKAVIDAAQHQSLVPESAIYGDLDLDTSFASGGGGFLDFNDPQGNHDEARRVFYRCENIIGGICTESRYYVVGKHRHGASWDAAIAKLDFSGAFVASMTVPTSMARIDDVVLDPETGRLYFIGAQRVFLLPDLQFTVFCMDVDTEAACSGFAASGNAAGYRFHLFDLGGSNNDVGTRAVLDPAGFLTVGGWAEEANGYQLAVWKLNATTGESAPGFGTDGGVHYALGSATTGRDHNVYGMALSSSGLQLYLAGSFVAGTGDYDGYVLRLGTVTGSLLYVRDIYYEQDNTPFKGDAVTALTVLANGDLAMAGFSDTMIDNQPALMLAKVHADPSLSLDTDFCGGGVCVEDVGVEPHGWHNTLPSAIGERPGNRDLVIGMQAGTWTYDFGNEVWNLSQKQVVWQFGANGNTSHARHQISFPSFDGDSDANFSAGMLVDDNYVELAGSRVWDTATDDFDFTVTRFIANDAIFANQFGGPNSD